MERPVGISDILKGKEANLGIAITTEASAHLKRLVLRPNPNLAEFAFLGLGQDNLVDQILIVDESNLLNKPGLFRETGMSISRIGMGELVLLFVKLESIKRTGDLLVFGHLHPSGEKRIGGVLYSVTPSEALLEPSMGTPKEGGPAGAHDVGFFKEFVDEDPKIDVPYVGIAAITRNGPKLRIYNTYDLIRIKRYRDIDHVPQITIQL